MMKKIFLFLTGNLLFFCSLAALAQPVTFANVCQGFTLRAMPKDNPTEVWIMCPGKTEPWLKFKGCVGASAKRSGENVTIICKKVIPVKE